jgi:hypothetical protein
VLDPGSIGFRILAAIASRRVLFDPAGFATETDRAADVVDPAALADGEHFIASNKPSDLLLGREEGASVAAKKWNPTPLKQPTNASFAVTPRVPQQVRNLCNREQLQHIWPVLAGLSAAHARGRLNHLVNCVPTRL